MPEDKELIRKRASFKGKVTVFVNYLNTLDPSSLSPTEVSELQFRFIKLEALYAQYDEVQLLLECTTDNLDSQILERSDFESLYYKTLAQAQKILDHNIRKRDSNESGDGSSRSNNHTFVKLPTIQLPKFSGSYTNWLEFHDTFVSLIHSNDDMNEINKFHYLRSSLEGSAAVVINSIQFSAANYSVAWELLCERFDNKHLLIQHHISALFQIDTLQKESSVNLKALLDIINKNLRALESLGEPVSHWDTLLIYIITHKFDSKTYREWEEYKGCLAKDSKITFTLFITFIKNRAEILETLELASSTSNKHSNTGKHSKQVRTMMAQDSSKPNSCDNRKQDDGTSNKLKNCVVCDGDHKLSNCAQFLSLNNESRLKLLPKYRICYNCFNPGHYANSCKKFGCKICRRKHNTLVHVDIASKPSRSESTGASSSSDDTNSSANVSTQSAVGTGLSLSASVEKGDVLLSTALVKVMGINGQQYVARAVLDSGSTSCLMTERLFHQLGVTAKSVNNSILGINNSSSFINKMCSVSVKSLNNNFSVDVNCFILPSITDKIPSTPVNLLNIKIPHNICLADPNFHSPGPVDMLLGADIFWDLLESQQIKLGDGQPILCETKLGWLVSGPIKGNASSKVLKCNFIKVNTDCDDKLNLSIDQQLTKFWQLEEVCTSSPYSLEEKLCEEHFVKNTIRLENGQFCVRIPLKCSPDQLGESLTRAKHCFSSLESRFKSKTQFCKMYREFMLEYETLGHMSKCKFIDDQACYIPHHGILREGSTTTKLRVVFNASSLTRTGTSINNIQMVGPVVQDDLLSILLRFRQHVYILAADVEKMYRQIVVHPNDRYLQQIIWRDNPSSPLQAYQLNTVTYGTASAPYLATRCLRQLGLDLECIDNKVSEVILHDFYVDDLLTGGDDLEQVKALRHKITSTLASAQMNLRKWKSNDMQLVTGSDFPQSSLDLNIGGSESTKILGLGWQPQSDSLCFPISQSINFNTTKRDMLSIVSQVFDPLGLLAPCVIAMKMLLQKLWLHKLSWDEQLPPEINTLWNAIVTNFPKLNEIHIPRRVLIDSYEFLEFHIFTDASERAYGACLYVRSVDSQGQILVRLLSAKSRVAPLKPTTIPRLELSGALVGVRLYEKVVAALRVSARRMLFWTDSTIVLGWLKMLPNKLQPFVRNRVAEILDKTGGCEWRHVPTDQNPADYVSRGVEIDLLPTLDDWWSGPKFLLNETSYWPSKLINFNEVLPELKSDVTLHVLLDDNDFNELINFTRFSNLLRLQRAVAYVLRFIDACRKHPTRGPLTTNELDRALNLIIRISQNKYFKDYKLLLHNKPLPKKSELNKFNVFLDENKIMRIRGRLQHSDFPYNKKHPVLIHSSHHFSKLLFNYEHKRLFHAGPQLLLASIRDTYWPIRGRSLARMCCRQCVRCCRFKGETVSPIMGDLPQQRLLAGFPFENIGLDYAGPIQSAVRQGRGCKLVKVYIAIFVCFSTKSIHLELVGDLTSNTFIMALKRFISRRGKPKNIYSDNGTSFVGAYNDLSKFIKSNCDSVAEEMAKEGINFHFIPAYSPHFAGLAEAGVKSTKHHLTRVLGLCNLTYEELYTMMVQVEAILNSRPLTPLSSNPEDLMPLTPGHFLIGRPMTSLPSPDYRDQSINTLTRFQRIELLRQHFWRRWSNEYISELQLRTKWRACKGSLKLNSLVLLKEDNLPPLKWKMGRIIATYPGTDGVVRVAVVKTSSGMLRRSFSKICPLPVYPESEDSG